MTRPITLLLTLLAVVGCDDSTTSRPSALPDNLKDDRPIVLKEGQAVVLVPEGNKALMIGASVLDGKLSIAEIDPEGKNFGVTWNDEESWETSTIHSDEGQVITTIDKDGDGLPDLRAVMTEGALHRYHLLDPKWAELESKNKSEGVDPNRSTAPALESAFPTRGSDD